MSAVHDLRSFIAVLESAGQLARVRRPVSLKQELATVAAALERSGGAAPLFECPQFVEGEGHEWPVFSSGVATHERTALALGCSREEVINVMGRALDPANAIPPQRGAEAAWKANVLQGDEIDIRRLPIPWHAEHDGGPFITGGVMVSKDPESGRGNLSYNRMQIQGPRRFGCNMNEWHDIYRYMAVAEKRGQPLECAMSIGLDPAIMISGACTYDGDEILIAGAIRGEGVPVAKGVTVDVDIPAEAEIVIEGHLLPGVRKEEGPLAEFHGYFGEPWNSPVFEVTAVCFRDKPIFQTVIPGWNEHVYLGNVLPREPLLLRFVRHITKNVHALHLAPYANGFMAIVQIDKRNPGEPHNAAMAVFTAHVNPHMCIVVDTDVDIYDPADVLWALTSRVDWEHDIFTVPMAQGHEMDPVLDHRGMGTKIGIDATEKGRRGYGRRVRYNPVDLSKYLGATR
jgi:2,5-furandicarboxylate decarboxylase 1